MTVSELTAPETHLAYEAMVGLRNHVGTLEDFVATINDRQRPDGYRLVASFEGDEVAAIAGFRRGHSLAWSEFVYVDDLITVERFRGRGHARRLLAWIRGEAHRLGCRQLHLDSGAQRHDAHRLYLAAGYQIVGFHFTETVEEPQRG